MQKKSTSIDGLLLIEFAPNSDKRGFFVRNHCDQSFKDMGIDVHFSQSSLSFNHLKGTLRGMHMQNAPHSEVKLVQCLSGSIYDVILDLRPQSKTYKKWEAFELSLEKQNALLVPAGCAHGFVTLTDNTLIQYRIDKAFETASQTGIRWNDPAWNIKWPLAPLVISDRDSSFPDWIA